MPGQKYGQKWSEDETILAFNLYCAIPFGKIHKNNPRVIELAELLGRPPSSVVHKLGNLGHFDPELQKRGVRGLSNASRTDEAIVLRFRENWEELSFFAKKLEAEFKGVPLEELIELRSSDLPVGDEREQLIRARVNQRFFRETVLSSYQQECCVTGITAPELLVASHIKPWRDSDPFTERTDPANGLCLNALHDRAFDNGFITVLPDMTVRISNKLRQIDPAGMAWLLKCDRQAIRKPTKFIPDKAYLEYHNDVVFKP